MPAATSPSPAHTHLQRAIHLVSCALQPLLDRVQATALAQKPLQLVAELGLPEADVRQPLGQVLAGPLLHLVRQLLLVVHEPQAVTPRAAGPLSQGLSPAHLLLVALVPVMGVVATEERGTERGQDGGRRQGTVACGPLTLTGLGAGDLVEEAGSPRVEVAVPRQVIGLVTFLDYRGWHSPRQRPEVTGLLGATVTGGLSGSKKLHPLSSAPHGQNSVHGPKAPQQGDRASLRDWPDLYDSHRCHKAWGMEKPLEGDGKTHRVGGTKNGIYLFFRNR